MSDRSCLRVLLSLCLAIPFIGCGSSSEIDSVQVSPSTVSITGVGLTAQLTATGIIGHGAHPSTSQDITSTATWTSSSNAVATVSSSGLVTSTGGGTATITASIQGFTGIVSASSAVTVSSTSPTGPTNGDVITIAITPGTQAVTAPGQTGQFIAIGTTASGATENLTNSVMWSSSGSSVATISGTGLATAVGQGTTTITAILTNADKSVATGTATFTVSGGTSEQFTAVSIIPGSQSLSASGGSGQFIALATSGSTGLLENVTNSPNMTWTSSIPSIATVSSTGLVSGVAVGTSTITALLTNTDNSVVSANATVSVTLTAAPEPLLSLTIVPGSETVGNLQDTGQFLAIGTFSDVPFVRDVTNDPSTTWISSFPDSFPVNTNAGGTPSASAGIVTAYASGSATIIAEYQSADKTIQTATATFNCPLALPNPAGDPPTAGTCNVGEAGPLKSTLTIYGEGLNVTGTNQTQQGNWLVTAPSATGTPDVIHCGPGWTTDGNSGGSVCTGIYPDGSRVIITAPAQTGVAFGGWTYNCTPSDANGNALPGPVFYTAAGPNYCTITLQGITNINGSSATNATVGAIFNNQ